MFDTFLLLCHKIDVIDVLQHPDKEKYFAISINFIELLESDPKLANKLLNDPENSLKSWDLAIFNVQRKLVEENEKNKWLIKNNVTCRVYSLAPWSHISFTTFPGNAHTDKFLQISGTVTRMSAKKLFEYQRQYLCTKCKYPITVEAQFDKMNIIKAPKKCTNPEGCPGKNIITFGELDPYNCKDYQEIKIQEDLSKPGIGSTPNHLVVILEDDLVNTCKPGENVTICGILKRRWSEFSKGAEIKIDLALKANHVQVNNNTGSAVQISQEIKDSFKEFWEGYREKPLIGRNVIVGSIAPELYGLHLVKLAIAIVLAGGCQNSEECYLSTGTQTRAQSHILLVGDPGTGKSELLRFASKTVRRSVLTTGVGSTAAGLTVTSVMERGQWQLEAGALVMSDGGICCIDEFNSMKEHDRTSIHEAMEQQTISVAKGGIVCKLVTRCSILAACNPKGNIDLSKPLCMNVAMSSPLLSRFDLIMLIKDTVNSDNDKKLAQNFGIRKDQACWNLEKLQAYYAVIKELQPKLTDDAETILSTYYQLQRRLDTRNKSRTTVRLLESLIRLSQGHAKLMFHSEVQVVDTIFAVILVDAALDYDSSLLSLKVSNNSFFEDPETTHQQLSESILRKLNLEYIWQRELEKKNAHKNNVGGSESSGYLFESSVSDNLEGSIHLEQLTNNPHILSSTQNDENLGTLSTSKQDIFSNVPNKNPKSSFPRLATRFDNLYNDDLNYLDKSSRFDPEMLARMKSKVNIQKESSFKDIERPQTGINNSSQNYRQENFSQNSESGYSSINNTTSDLNKSNLIKKHKENNTTFSHSNSKKKVNSFARIGLGLQNIGDMDLDFDKPNNNKSEILSQVKKRRPIENDKVTKKKLDEESGYSSVNKTLYINKSILGNTTESKNVVDVRENLNKSVPSMNVNSSSYACIEIDENSGTPSTCFQQNIFSNLLNKNQFNRLSQSFPKYKSSFPRFDSLNDHDLNLDNPSGFGPSIFTRMKNEVNIRNAATFKDIAGSQRETMNSKQNNYRQESVSQNSERGYSSDNNTLSDLNKNNFIKNHIEENNTTLSHSNSKKRVNLFARIRSGLENIGDWDLDFDKSDILSQIKKRRHLENDGENTTNLARVGLQVQNFEELNFSIDKPFESVLNISTNLVKMNTSNNKQSANEETLDNLDLTQPNDRNQNTRTLIKLKSFQNLDDLDMDFGKPSKILSKLKSKSTLNAKDTSNFEKESIKQVPVHKSTKFEDRIFDDFDEPSNIISQSKSRENLEGNSTQENKDTFKIQQVGNTNQVSEPLERCGKKSKFQFKSKLNAPNSNETSVDSYRIQNLVGSDLDIKKSLSNGMTEEPITFNDEFYPNKPSENPCLNICTALSSESTKNIADKFNLSESQFEEYNRESALCNNWDNEKLKTTNHNKKRYNKEQTSPDKSKKKKELETHRKLKNRGVDEFALLKNIPSVNDDFAKFNLDLNDF